MEKSEELKQNKQLFIQCGDYCGLLQLEEWDWGDGQKEVFISYNLPAFYAYQSPGWTGIKERLHLIWSAITGKQYRLYEIILDGQNLENFKNKMKEFLAEEG